MNANHLLSRLMDPISLKQHLAAYTIIDSIMNSGDEAWTRIFEAFYDDVTGVAQFTVTGADGDHYHILFTEDGCLIKGFAPESDLGSGRVEEMPALPADGLYASLPAPLRTLLEEDETLDQEDVTFCIWRENGDDVWQTAALDPVEGCTDGFETFLSFVPDREQYPDWFYDRYEMDIDSELFLYILNGGEIRTHIIDLLNADADLDYTEEALAPIFAMFPPPEEADR